MGLRELTELCGVSGDEHRVRHMLAGAARPICDELIVDSMGNLIAIKGKQKPGPRVMLAAHMDEVGFIVCGIGENGLLHFKKVGGIDDKMLLGKQVLVGEELLPGVIGGKPFHLLKPDEHKRMPGPDDLFIDIGAESKKEAEDRVSIGDYATFATRYTEFGADMVKAKALDDRVGCHILLQLLALDLPYPLYVAFTVQEEIGLRGARTAAYSIDPDLALVVEGTTCADVPGTAEHGQSTTLGAGPALSFMDRSAIADPKLMQLILTTAEKHQIPYQLKKTVTGGTDAGVIHQTRAGVPSAVISIPCRYIHSPASVAALSDITNAERLVAAVLAELPERGDGLWKN